MRLKHYSRKKRQLKNLVGKFEKVNSNSNFSIANLQKIATNIKLLTKQLAPVVPAHELKKVLGVALVLFSINSSDALAQSFEPGIANPFGMTQVAEYAYPAAADIDADGDIDFLVAEEYGAIKFFENIGDENNPSFADPVTNPFNLNNIPCDDFAFPTLGDIDGDGDFDLICGNDNDQIIFIENNGTSENPNFNSPEINPFGFASLNYYSIPTMADLDDDGDLDLLYGGYNIYGDAFFYYENIGTPGNIEFEDLVINPFNLPTSHYISFPTFGDIDGDGDLDLIFGSVVDEDENSFGYLNYCENNGTAANPNFADPIQSPFGLSILGEYCSPILLDIDDDGDLDIMTGEYSNSGFIVFYENTSAISGIADSSNPLNIKLFPNPLSSNLNIDFDGVLSKLVIYNINGQIVYSANNPSNEINLEFLSTGNYEIMLYDAKGNFATKTISKN